MKYQVGLTGKQLLLIVLLVVALELPLSLWEWRTESTSEVFVWVTYTGFPFYACRINNTVDFDLSWSRDDPTDILDKHVQGDNSATGYPPWDPQQGLGAEHLVIRKTHECLWIGIALNTLIFTILSAIMVKSTTWLRDEIEYRRYT